MLNNSNKMSWHSDYSERYKPLQLRRHVVRYFLCRFFKCLYCLWRLWHFLQDKWLTEFYSWTSVVKSTQSPRTLLLPIYWPSQRTFSDQEQPGTAFEQNLNILLFCGVNWQWWMKSIFFWLHLYFTPKIVWLIWNWVDLLLLHVFANVWMMTVCLNKLVKTQHRHSAGAD